jgi:hypothetical protein
MIEIARRYEQRWRSADGGSANYESVDGGPTELVIVRPGWEKAERHLFAVQIPEGWLQFHPDGSVAARGCGILEGGPSVDIFQVDPAGVPYSSSVNVCYRAFHRGDGRPEYPCTHDRGIPESTSTGSEFDPEVEVETPVSPVPAPLRAVPEPEPEPAFAPEPVPVQANGMMEVPYVTGPGEGTNIADIETSPSWGPSNGSRRGPRFLGL